MIKIDIERKYNRQPNFAKKEHCYASNTLLPDERKPKISFNRLCSLQNFASRKYDLSVLLRGVFFQIHLSKIEKKDK